MAIKIDGTGTLTFNDNSTQTSAFDFRYTGHRNMIMNALYLVNQRASNGANTQGTNAAYVADRWRIDTGITQMSVEMITDANTSPSLYTPTCIRMRANAALAAPTSTQYAFLTQGIEGTLMGRLKWGTASAKPVTISFRAAGSVAGTMSVCFRNGGFTRAYVTTVAVTTTPQRYEITIPGDTTGTWETGSNWGVQVCFTFVGGASQFATSTKDAWTSGNYIAHTSQTNFNATINNEIRISDVQLEAGSIASPLEIVEFQDELIRCMRYFQQGNYIWRGQAVNTITSGGTNVLKVDMRVAPTVTPAYNSRVGFPTVNATINGTATTHFDISCMANGTGGGIFADYWTAFADQ